MSTDPVRAHPFSHVDVQIEAIVSGTPKRSCNQDHGADALSGGVFGDTGAAAAHASWADFERVGLRAGTIRRVEPFPEARRPAYKLWIDFGPYGTKQSSAQLTALYASADLVGRQVICATGLGPKRVAGFKSEVLVTGFATEDGAIVLACADRAVSNGSVLC